MPILDLENPSIGDPYASLEELKARMTITGTNEDDALEEALRAASTWIDNHTERQFGADVDASARIYHSLATGALWIDDFWTTDGLVVKTDSGNDGTYETTWTSSDYQALPATSHTGWPYGRLLAVGNRSFSNDRGVRSPIEVTAKWGWATVPSPVKEATLILAEALHKLKDAPFGVAGFDQWGSVRVRENPYVCSLLEPYRRHLTLVG